MSEFSEENFNMAKKNLCLGGRNAETDIMGYRTPTFHQTAKSCYVDFYCFDPARGEMRRKKIHLERYKKKSDRKRHADLLIHTLTDKLCKGWNPWVEAVTDRSFTDFDEVLDRYLEYIEKTCRERTQEAYRSKMKVLKEYNILRHHPIRYVYEYDREFLNGFLDHIILDRDAGARTRNNYRQWCYALGEWMISRKYIETNPGVGIKKISEAPKKRQPLSPEMMRRLRDYLTGHDRPFLLACLMEYYTFIRPGELTSLRIGDIRIKEQKIYVSGQYSKNKRDGYVGLNDTLIKLMLDLGVLTRGDDLYLFGKKFLPGRSRQDPDIFNKRWVQVRKALGWGDEYQFYSLKDTGIRDLANAAGIVIARDQARHSDISTTNKYLGHSDAVHIETQSFRGALS